MNSFLKTLEYPAEGERGEYPYPFHDTGKEATGMTYTGNPWDEEDTDDKPFQARGTLLIRPSPFGGFQCAIRDKDDEEWDVDPKTVEPVTEATAPEEDNDDEDGEEEDDDDD